MIEELCSHPGCGNPKGKKGPTCDTHASTTRKCQAPDCGKCAQGSTKFCIAHGGGRRCTFPMCTKGARDRFFCAAHGGGKRCVVPDCVRSAVGGTNICTSHGGGRKCYFEGCTKSAQSPTDYCVRHGGGKQCDEPGCTKVSRGKSNRCASHGGGNRCETDGCVRTCVPRSQYCKWHTPLPIPQNISAFGYPSYYSDATLDASSGTNSNGMLPEPHDDIFRDIIRIPNTDYVLVRCPGAYINSGDSTNLNWNGSSNSDQDMNHYAIENYRKFFEQIQSMTKTILPPPPPYPPHAAAAAKVPLKPPPPPRFAISPSNYLLSDSYEMRDMDYTLNTASNTSNNFVKQFQYCQPCYSVHLNYNSSSANTSTNFNSTSSSSVTDAVSKTMMVANNQFNTSTNAIAANVNHDISNNSNNYNANASHMESSDDVTNSSVKKESMKMLHTLSPSNVPSSPSASPRNKKKRVAVVGDTMERERGGQNDNGGVNATAMSINMNLSYGNGSGYGPSGIELLSSADPAQSSNFSLQDFIRDHQRQYDCKQLKRKFIQERNMTEAADLDLVSSLLLLKGSKKENSVDGEAFAMTPAVR